MQTDLLERKATHFVLWAPHEPSAPPRLVIGEFQPGTPPTLANRRGFGFEKVQDRAGLWQIAAASCGLQEGRVYHYWFEVENTEADGEHILVCDPTAFTTDWRLYEDDQPAAVIKWQGGRLVPCDPGGDVVTAPASFPLNSLPTNNQLIIYELPTAWTRCPRGGGVERGVGTFRDVLALVDRNAEGANFVDLAVTQQGRSYLTELGINAIELLPPADSYYDREWGYGTSHYFAPDYELGFPEGFSWPTANADLRRLVEAMHRSGIRLIVDGVYGFARFCPVQHVAFDEFHILPADAADDDPDAWSSRPGEKRNPWGGRNWRYVRETETYDPVSGQVQKHACARRYLLTALARWMRDFHVDGFRLDSIESIANWDFIGEFTARGREHFRERHNNQSTDADARFLVVGEELHHPLDIIRQGRVNGLWNDKFRECIRPALLGRNSGGRNFENTVKDAIDCRRLGFHDGAEAVNYLGSHDVEGFNKERLATFFRYNGFNDEQIERRMRLAFVCLLTSVGIPMMLAGEEFGDEHDLFDRQGHIRHEAGKQVDPVNFHRLQGENNEWRRRLFAYVSRLVHLRRSHPALGRNDIEFIHADFTPGRRIMAWKRGTNDNPVVVVANFSDFESDAPEYRVPNWPVVPGRQWREVSQQRDVPDEWVAREPLFAWEAKVYALRV